MIFKSATHGNVHGLFNYGMVLINGQGFEKNTEEGLKYLKKAADHGCQEAQVSYAYLLLDKDNQSPEKICEGLEYFQKAMNQDYAEAYCSYAFILKEGINVEKNAKLAMEYFKIAADKNVRDAMFEYAEGNLKGIGVPKNEQVALKYFQLAAANGDEEAKSFIVTLTKKDEETKTTKKQKSLSSVSIKEEKESSKIVKKSKFKFPIQLSPKLKLVSLGTVVYDRKNYHTDKYIYPIGYTIERESFSIENPNEQTIYRATILDGGESPLFRVQCLDKTNMKFEGYNPSKPWIDAFLAVEESKRKLGMPAKNTVKLSGHCYFGFTLFTVMYLIEKLPDADKCTNYKFKKFYIKGIDEPMSGGKEVKFFNEKDIFENEEDDDVIIIDSPNQEDSNDAINSPIQEDSNDAINSPIQEDSNDAIYSPNQEDSADIINSPNQEDSTNTNNDHLSNEPTKITSFQNSERISSLFDDTDFSQFIDFDQPTENLIRLGDDLSQKDPTNAFKCYQEAANRGNPNAYLKCAKMSPSFETKLEYCEMAMKNNIPGSFVQWRKSIIKHISISKNKDIIFNLAQRFEKYNDFSDAAYLYRIGKDMLNFQICYEKAKKNIDNIKDGYQQYNFGKLAAKQKEFDLAKEMFRKALENNVQDARNRIDKIDQLSSSDSPSPEPVLAQKIENEVDKYIEEAINFYEGRNGREVTPYIAVTLFMKASEIGSSVADFYLGNHYQNETGAIYMKKAADAGNVDAQFRYADYLFNGTFVDKNYHEAMKYYKMAADQGNAEASCIYGHELYTNSSNDVEKKKGISYLKKSADKLFPDAIYYYSKVISETNPFDSLKFYEYSLEKGSKLAIKEEDYRRNLISFL